MTPVEAKLVVACAVVILAIALWLFLPMIWRRRQVRVDRVAEKRRRLMEEVVLPMEAQIAATITTYLDPEADPVLTAAGRRRLAELADPDDWLAGDPPTWDFPEKWQPPGRLVDFDSPRPWATFDKCGFGYFGGRGFLPVEALRG